MLKEGYSVQLKHDEREEGRGWVTISLLLEEVEEGNVVVGAEKTNGGILIRSEDVQHNQNYYEKEEMLEKMAIDAIKQVLATTGKKEGQGEVAPIAVASSVSMSPTSSS